jgi:hypothetical protein
MAGLNLLPAPDVISHDRWIGMKGVEKRRTCKTMKNNAP